MKKFTILMVAIMSLLSVCLGLTACGKDKKDNVVRVSEVTHSLFYAPLYIAMNNGYFADEGLEIELTNAGGSDAEHYRQQDHYDFPDPGLADDSDLVRLRRRWQRQ